MLRLPALANMALVGERRELQGVDIVQKADEPRLPTHCTQGEGGGRGERDRAWMFHRFSSEQMQTMLYPACCLCGP